MFVEEFKRKAGTIWIMKPAGRAQGKGIFLFTDLKDITDWKKVPKINLLISILLLCKNIKYRNIKSKLIMSTLFSY